MSEMLTTLTERGQVSLPSRIRRQLRLKPGQPLLWRCVSDREIRVTVPSENHGESMRGFIRKLDRKSPATTAAWMKLLREAETA
jgi:AbrB family looped-hinge helix DNA binding protein